MEILYQLLFFIHTMFIHPVKKKIKVLTPNLNTTETLKNPISEKSNSGIYIYIYIYIYISSSSTSSCSAGSTDIPDHLSQLFPIVYRLRRYIPYPHIVAECMFMLVVLLLHGHVWGSARVHHLWVRPCFSSSVLHDWFVLKYNIKGVFNQ